MVGVGAGAGSVDGAGVTGAVSVDGVMLEDGFSVGITVDPVVGVVDEATSTMIGVVDVPISVLFVAFVVVVGVVVVAVVDAVSIVVVIGTFTGMVVITGTTGVTIGVTCIVEVADVVHGPTLLLNSPFKIVTQYFVPFA